MSSESEKMLSSALKVFNTKLSDRQVIKLEGMEDYLKVPQYKALVNLEKKASQLEVDAVLRVMNSRIAYLKAVQELRACEMRWLEEIRVGMDSLEERNRIVKDVNTKMKKGDYSVLQPATTVTANAPNSSSRTHNTATKPPILRRPEAALPALPPEMKPALTDIKKRLAMINLDCSSSRSPLTSRNVNRIVDTASTPKSGPIISSKGSLDGSVVPNRRNPPSPPSRSRWDVPAPNFDDTIDTEPVRLPNSILPPHRPLPTVLLRSPEVDEEAEDTFPLVRPSLPYQTPTAPHSRPFLLSSMRKEAQQQQQQLPVLQEQPVRPTPSFTLRTATSADPLSNLGLMKMKRPVLNSEVGKKLMGL
ncbi:hypothetical protein PENTCL1PPCAC_13023 [Pristionchus entomophagus]|uniref:Uncharacterized protein n=1 Tax=Pristionchus entomophagus TaxID=358040 RepID=A0AAV5T9S1_9BILA|nr:hypothetical protein PENTCL1PPCAC_13023 [Pristionchus entomophagus]